MDVSQAHKDNARWSYSRGLNKVDITEIKSQLPETEEAGERGTRVVCEY